MIYGNNKHKLWQKKMKNEAFAIFGKKKNICNEAFNDKQLRKL